MPDRPHLDSPLSFFPPQTASVALNLPLLPVVLFHILRRSPSSQLFERSAPHSPLGLPPSRPAVALTGRARWLSPDRSLASGRQPAPTRSLHEGQSDAGECCVCVVMCWYWTPAKCMCAYGAGNQCTAVKRDCRRLHHCAVLPLIITCRRTEPDWGQTVAVRYFFNSRSSQSSSLMFQKSPQVLLLFCFTPLKRTFPSTHKTRQEKKWKKYLKKI